MAEKYSQGKGVVAFSREALEMLEQQGLVIEDKKETTLMIPCTDGTVAARLVKYRIVSGFVDEVPSLFMVDLFLEKSEHTIMIWSYSTNLLNEQDIMVQAFSEMKCM